MFGDISLFFFNYESVFLVFHLKYMTNWLKEIILLRKLVQEFCDKVKIMVWDLVKNGIPWVLLQYFSYTGDLEKYQW